MLAELERRGVAELKGRWAGRGGNGSSRDATPRGSGQVWSAGLGRSIQCVSVDSCFFFCLVILCVYPFPSSWVAAGETVAGRGVLAPCQNYRGTESWEAAVAAAPRLHLHHARRPGARDRELARALPASLGQPPAIVSVAPLKTRTRRFPSSARPAHLPRLPTPPPPTLRPGLDRPARLSRVLPPSRLPPRSDFEAKRQALAIHLPAP